MKHKILSLVLALTLALGLAGCGAQAPAPAQPQPYSTTWFDLFDTVTIIQGFAESQEEWDAQMDALHEDLARYHQLYDIYNPMEGEENLYSVNRKAGQGPVKVDDKILDLLELSLEVYDKTNGKMNVAMGSMLRLWHDARELAEANPENAVLPEMSALEAAAQHRDPAGIILDREAGTVELTDPGLQLDVGSIGKGYAVEMSAQTAEARGLTHALLNVGGNLRSIGSKPDGVHWTAGVQDPSNLESYLCAVYLDNMALVTSGDYQRYFMVDGQRMHHLIDPDTLMPAAYSRSVSVLTPNSGFADGMSTALFCMSPEEGLALVESMDDVEAMWVLTDGTIQQSSGFDDHMPK